MTRRALFGLFALPVRPSATAPQQSRVDALRAALRRIRHLAEQDGGTMRRGSPYGSWRYPPLVLAVPPEGSYARPYWNVAARALRQDDQRARGTERPTL